NYEPLAADPLGSMRAAAAGVAPVHLLVAMEFVSSADRPEASRILADVLATGSPDLAATAVNAIHHLRAAAAGTPLAPLAKPLVEALVAHPDRARPLAQGLSALSGASFPEDARLWQDWWTREQSRGGSVPLDAGAGDERRPEGGR